MPQNVYDDPEFFEGYSRLRRSVHGLAGAPEWPAVRRVLPDLHGKRVVDLGCGFGSFCRWAAASGAARVVGYDLSEKMLERARRDTEDPNVEYVRANLESLELDETGFDLAFSSLALHYVADFRRLVAAVHSGLVPGGSFVFTVEHPIFTAPLEPAWAAGADGRRAWPVSSYAAEGTRVRNWFKEGVRKQHRTLGTTINTLVEEGFTIRRVDEWSPSPDQVAEQPDLADELERPLLVLIAAEH